MPTAKAGHFSREISVGNVILSESRHFFTVFDFNYCFWNYIYNQTILFMKKILTLLSVATLSIFQADAQFSNAGLETWQNYNAGFPSATLERPADWYGIDSIIYTYAVLLGSTPQQTLYKDNSAHTGSFAVKLVSKDLGGFVAPGILANANPQFDFTTFDPNDPTASLAYTGGTSVSQRYYTLSAWIKYIPAGNDYAAINVNAVLSGAGAGGTDSVVGEGEWFINTTANYTQVDVPITYNDPNVVPDKIVLSFSSSDLSGANSTTPQDGSTLYVDDIALSTIASVKDVYNQENLCEIFPNPVKDFLQIVPKTENALTVKIYNSFGAMMSQKDFKGKIELSVKQLAEGNYFYKVFDVKKQTLQQDQFSVVK